MKRLIIHIGAPKCGSSALQSSLEILERSGSLLKIGTCYPLEYSRGMGQGNSEFLFNDISSKSEDYSITKQFIQGIEADTVILSDETLFGILFVGINNIYKVLHDLFDEIIVLVAIREPSSWLISDYSQYIKQDKSFDDFIKHVVKREKIIDWEIFLKQLNNQCQDVKIHVTDYKKLFDCVEDLLAVDKGFLSNIDNKNVNVNFSIPSEQLEFTRLKKMLSLTQEQSDKLQKNIPIHDFRYTYWPLIDFIKLKYSEKYKNIAKLEYIHYYK